ncbi:MAG: GNAT family N-acetyltransferase [Acidimicrobiia bacterium]|nr:GNAT family N-acetyltransferase [Acidimicrobiia bacterium]
MGERQAMPDAADSITTYLEMREALIPQVTPLHRSGMLLRIGEPVAAFYRYLCGELGGPPPDEDDEDLATRLLDDARDVYVVYLGGVPAAMFELDRRRPGEIEIGRFGVLEGFTGRGLDRYVIASAVETAWRYSPERVWVASKETDDPRRILLLQWAGFIPYRTSREPTGGVG